MRSNWNTSTLEEVVEKFIDYRGKTPKKTNQGIPLITAKIIKEGFIQNINEFIAEEDYETWMRRGIPQKGDIVLTTEAPLGEVAQINTDKKIALAQRVITLRGKKGILDNTFLKYSLQGRVMQSRLRERESGSTVTGIKSAELKKVNIEYPDIDEQVRIGRVLKNLDDKISLNNQVISNFELLAQTLFKHWFVEFEFPNENGDPYHSSAGKMVESDIGLIPEDWNVGCAGELFEFSPKTTLKRGTNTVYVEMKNLSTSAVIKEWSERSFTGSGSKFINGDTLLARITPCLENGKIGFVDFLKNGTVGWGSTEFITIRSKEPISPAFSFFFVSQNGFKNYAITNMNGSSGRQRVAAATLAQYPTVIPPHNVIEKYTDILEPIMRKLTEIRDETKNLVELRDVLLPKLLSGEIQLRTDKEVD